MAAPRASLGALPDELQERLHTVERTTRESPHLLLEAVMSVGRGLELSQVLRRDLGHRSTPGRPRNPG
ncbi:hypothetical protein [Streptomyces inhibens]